ncbi:MAG: Trp biosynthesis-associated membrane protein, partial [Actinomycetota bacterium]|nr:Trp biosynthesis-associated membrane protein [Actinomycetota bacterium]
AVLGGLLLATGRRWPDRSRRFTALRTEAADGSAGSIDEWDALSDGSDPTVDPRDRRDGLDRDAGTAG